MMPNDKPGVGALSHPFVATEKVHSPWCVDGCRGYRDELCHEPGCYEPPSAHPASKSQLKRLEDVSDLSVLPDDYAKRLEAQGAIPCCPREADGHGDHSEDCPGTPPTPAEPTAGHAKRLIESYLTDQVEGSERTPFSPTPEVEEPCYCPFGRHWYYPAVIRDAMQSTAPPEADGGKARWNLPCQEYISDHGQVCPRCKWHKVEHPPQDEKGTSMTDEVRALREELSERSARVRSLKVELEAQQHCAIELMNKYEAEKRRADDLDRRLTAAIMVAHTYAPSIDPSKSLHDAIKEIADRGQLEVSRLQSVERAIGQLAENVAEDCDHHGLKHPTWYRAVKRARKALGIEL